MTCSSNGVRRWGDWAHSPSAAGVTAAIEAGPFGEVRGTGGLFPLERSTLSMGSDGTTLPPRSFPGCIAPSSIGSPNSRRLASGPRPRASAGRRPSRTREPGTSAPAVSSRRSFATRAVQRPPNDCLAVAAAGCRPVRLPGAHDPPSRRSADRPAGPRSERPRRVSRGSSAHVQLAIPDPRCRPRPRRLRQPCRARRGRRGRVELRQRSCDGMARAPRVGRRRTGGETIEAEVDAPPSTARSTRSDGSSDPHRAIDWLSTFPQVILVALDEPP